MAESFDWGTYYKQFEPTREDEKEKRAIKDQQDAAAVGNLVGNVRQEALANANKGKMANKSQSDVTNLSSFDTARKTHEAQQAPNTRYAASPWEQNLQLGRQEGEQPNAWDTLGKKLVGVQQDANTANINARKTQRAQAEQTAQAEFNKRSKEIMANDKYQAKNADIEFQKALNKYGDMAYEQQKAGKPLQVSPYAMAMRDCNDGTGPCPPEETTNYVQGAQDPNNLNPQGAALLTAEQERLRRRLLAAAEDEGFSYGTGTDATSWF